ncbi:hypothetical protein F5Y11DRAFT_365366 [Daldinia sp. FL1419]|nr:hypothetical protein F5Y11DRAFT_365366 [Daldinia sp. FL1419]
MDIDIDTISEMETYLAKDDLPKPGRMISLSRRDMDKFVRKLLRLMKEHRWTEPSGGEDMEDADIEWLEDRAFGLKKPTIIDLCDELSFPSLEMTIDFLDSPAVRTAFRKTFAEPVLLENISYSGLSIDLVPLLMLFDNLTEMSTPYTYIKQVINRERKEDDRNVDDYHIIDFAIEVAIIMLYEQLQVNFGWCITEVLKLGTKQLIYIACAIIDLLTRQAQGEELEIGNGVYVAASPASTFDSPGSDSSSPYHSSGSVDSESHDDSNDSTTPTRNTDDDGSETPIGRDGSQTPTSHVDPSSPTGSIMPTGSIDPMSLERFMSPSNFIISPMTNIHSSPIINLGNPMTSKYVRRKFE